MARAFYDLRAAVVRLGDELAAELIGAMERALRRLGVTAAFAVFVAGGIAMALILAGLAWGTG